MSPAEKVAPRPLNRAILQLLMSNVEDLLQREGDLFQLSRTQDVAFLVSRALLLANTDNPRQPAVVGDHLEIVEIVPG